jgi:hypothetical protein
VRQALEDGVVLAVDRHQRRPGALDRGEQQVPGHHQGFLVGEQQALAGLRGRERGTQPRGPHDGRHDALHLRQPRQVLERAGAPEHAGPGRLAAQQARKFRRRGRIGERSVRWAEGEHLARQLCRVGVRRDRHQPEALRIPPQDIKRALAD